MKNIKHREALRFICSFAAIAIITAALYPAFSRSLSGFLGIEQPEKYLFQGFGSSAGDASEQAYAEKNGDGPAYIHIIDVGQGDSALLTDGETSVLIDAGPNASEDKLCAYLTDAGISDIDVMVLTHPHEDHIGGADAVLENFSVGEIITPDKSADSRSFEKVLECAEEKNLTISTVFRKDSFSQGSFDFDVLSPGEKEYADTNDYSIVLKVTYGNVSFMFTGDAEKTAEEEILSEFDREFLKCVFLKAGHHGSSTSNTEEFVGAVSPLFASVSCGRGNSYGHPHREVTALFDKLGVLCSRTDTDGSIVYVTDGESFALSDK